jgi:hypothetical protein
MAGLDPASHAELRLGQKVSPRACRRRFSMDTRVKPAYDEQNNFRRLGKGAFALRLGNIALR